MLRPSQRHRPGSARSTILSRACVLVVVLLGTCWAADGAPAVAQLTGRHTRVVWTQDAGPTASVYVEQPTLSLMGLDSRDGAGERVILAEQRGYWKPLLSAGGKPVYFTEKVVHLKSANPLAPPDEIALCAATAGQAQRIVISCSAGQIACWHNGVRLSQRPVASADPSLWAGRLALSDGGWAGTVSDIVVLSRVLTADEVMAHDRAATARAQGHTLAKQVVVDAVLIEATPAPDPRAIAPYTRCVSLAAWDVAQVVSGDLADKRIIVAQWSVMDERQLPEYLALKPGARQRLTLEALADHPEQDSERQTSGIDRVEDFAMYYDATPAAARSAP